jgi:hypothetical protein
MRAILIATALTMVAGPAWAQTCSTFGNTMEAAGVAIEESGDDGR